MASLTVFEDHTAFRARAEPFLARREPENNLLFGILYSISRGNYTDPLLTVLEEDREVTLAALRTPPHPLVLSAGPIEATTALAEALLARGEELSGVNGEEKQARAFADVWSSARGLTVHRELSTRIYALEEVSMPEGVPGSMRDAEERDTDLLVAWLTAFNEEALPEGDASRGNVAGRVDWYLRDTETGLTLWEVDGEPVSVSGHSGPTPTGIRIGPVYTPPEHRRNGFAAALVAAQSARLLAAGRRFCFLYTDLANPTSNSVYMRIGYRPIADAAVFRFRP